MDPSRTYGNSSTSNDIVIGIGILRETDVERLNLTLTTVLSNVFTKLTLILAPIILTNWRPHLLTTKNKGHHCFYYILSLAYYTRDSPTIRLYSLRKVSYRNNNLRLRP